MPTFTIMGSGIGFMGGNYKNDQPGQAAKKAAKALFKKIKERKYAKYKNKSSIKFVLRMRDRSGPGKTYSYLATQIKLKKPLVVKRGDVEYTVQYDYKVEACNLGERELKSMTLGQLTIVGGQMVYTGKKLMKGGTGYDDEISPNNTAEVTVGDDDDDFSDDDKYTKDANADSNADVDVDANADGGADTDVDVDVDKNIEGGGIRRNKTPKKQKPKKQTPIKSAARQTNKQVKGKK